MGVDIQLRFTLGRQLDPAALRKLAWRLAGAFYREEVFYLGIVKPQQAITMEVPGSENWPKDVPVQPGESLYTVHMMGRYYGPDYERGDPVTIIGVAEWIEANLPDARLWYGGDCEDQLSPFDQVARQVLKAHFWEYGHYPYASYIGGIFGPVKMPECKLCQEPMLESGGGGGISFCFCYGCTARAIADMTGNVLRYWTDKKDFFAVSAELRQEATAKGVQP